MTAFTIQKCDQTKVPSIESLTQAGTQKECRPRTETELVETINNALKQGNYALAEIELRRLPTCTLTSITQLLVDSSFHPELNIYPEQVLLTQEQIERLVSLCAPVQFIELIHYFSCIHVKLLRIQFGSSNPEGISTMISKQKTLIPQFIEKLAAVDNNQIRSGLVLIARNGGSEFFKLAYEKFKHCLTNFDIGIIMMSFPKMEQHLEPSILNVCKDLFFERKDQLSVKECQTILQFIPLSELAKQEMIKYVHGHRPDVQ